MAYPPKIQEFLDLLSQVSDRAEKIQILIDLSKSYIPADREKPYPEVNRVKGCESEVFTWVKLSDQGLLEIEIVVENPQGLSAMALGALLKDSLHHQSPLLAKQLDDEIVFALFGKELSMGKTMGLTNLVQQVKAQSLNLA